MSRRDVRRPAVLGLAAALALVLAACGDDDGATVREIGGSGSGSGSASGSASGSHASGSHSGSASGVACKAPEAGHETLEMTLDDYSIELADDEVAAGELVFVAENVGEHPHEVVVVKGVAPDELPIEDGKLDEAALPDGALLGEIEQFAPGQTCAGEFELEAGDYTLFCNVVEGDRSHAADGMATALTVTS